MDALFSSENCGRCIDENGRPLRHGHHSSTNPGQPIYENRLIICDSQFRLILSTLQTNNSRVEFLPSLTLVRLFDFLYIYLTMTQVTIIFCVGFLDIFIGHKGKHFKTMWKLIMSLVRSKNKKNSIYIIPVGISPALTLSRKKKNRFKKEKKFYELGNNKLYYSVKYYNKLIHKINRKFKKKTKKLRDFINKSGSGVEHYFSAFPQKTSKELLFHINLNYPTK